MKTFIQLLLGALVIIVIILSYLTIRSKNAPEQTEFLKGALPSLAPEGFYRGSTTFYRANWLGKTFRPADNTGDNRFAVGNDGVNKHPFFTYSGPGFRDAGIQTFKIDYRLPGNQFWIRPILDEIVEVSPGKYLGKIHYRVIPGWPFTIGYFRLEK